MKHKNKVLSYLLLSMPIFGLFLFSLKVNGYDDKTTHPGLTDEIVDFYNLSFENKINDQEKEWIVQGAIDEDVPPRWINHFYDPINGEGWRAENLGNVPPSTLRLFSKLLNFNSEIVPSTDWVHNETLQAKYANYGGNNTWENAIRQYADGNKQEAFYILGHILHLLEDKTVPDHTRNDTHAHEGSMLSKDDGSPYEDYCEQFTRNSLDIAQKLKQENAKPVALSSIDYYLNNLANYSNNYFFSEHTINYSKYNNPKIIREDGEYGYGKDKNGSEFHLIKKYAIWNNEYIRYDKIYTLKDKNNLVLSSYFSRLSRETVLNGAGAIKLFLDEAEKVKQDRNPIPAEPKISWWQKVRSPLFGGLAVLKDIGNKTQQVASRINSMPAAPPFVKTTIVPQVPIDQGIAKIVPMAKEVILPKDAQGAAGNMASSSQAVNAPTAMQPIMSAPVPGQIKSTSTPGKLEKFAPIPAVSSHFTPIHSNPYLELDAKISESPRAISSSTSASFIFYSTQTSYFEYDLNGNGWQPSGESLTLPDLLQGENVIEVRAVRNKEVDPTPAIFKWFVDSIAPEIDFEIKPGDYINSTSSIFKFSSDENVTYECNVNNAGWRDCGEDLIINDLRAGEQGLGVRVKDIAGNTASSSFDWLVDLTAPTSSVILASEYSEPNFNFNVFGADIGSTTQSGIESFNVGYKINGDWQELISGSTSTAIIFNKPAVNNDTIYFRVQAKDRAGNLGEWSEGQTKIVTRIADHLVISEIKIGGETANDEFVELYNPTDNDIELSGYKLKRKTSSGSEYNLVPDFGADKIPAKSYYLIAHPTGYKGNVTADMVYSSSNYSISSDNTIILYGNNSVIDKVGFGGAADFEGISYPDSPVANMSLIRKAFASSTVENIFSVYMWQGNGFDSGDNSADFILAGSDPENYFSPTEPRVTEPNVSDAPVLDVVLIATSSVVLFFSDVIDGLDLRYASSCDLQIQWRNTKKLDIGSAELTDQGYLFAGFSSGSKLCFGVKSFNGEFWSDLSGQKSVQFDYAQLLPVFSGELIISSGIAKKDTASSTPDEHIVILDFPNSTDQSALFYVPINGVPELIIGWGDAEPASRLILEFVYDDNKSLTGAYRLCTDNWGNPNKIEDGQCVDGNIYTGARWIQDGRIAGNIVSIKNSSQFTPWIKP